jgi:hypothetical protein
VTPSGLETLLVLVGNLGLATYVFYLILRPRRL